MVVGGSGRVRNKSRKVKTKSGRKKTNQDQTIQFLNNNAARLLALQIVCKLIGRIEDWKGLELGFLQRFHIKPAEVTKLGDDPLARGIEIARPRQTTMCDGFRKTSGRKRE